jgi:hypothetical protein
MAKPILGPSGRRVTDPRRLRRGVVVRSQRGEQSLMMQFARAETCQGMSQVSSELAPAAETSAPAYDVWCGGRRGRRFVVGSAAFQDSGRDQ